MKPVKYLVILASIFIASTISAAPVSLPETAKILPPQTMVMINIADFNSLQKQFQNTSIYKLYKDPSMAAFFDSFKNKWQKTILQSTDEMSKIISDVNTMPSGRAALVFVLNEKSKQTGEPVFASVSQWGKGITAIKSAVDKAVKKSVENGARQEKETLRGREIITITPKQSEPAKKVVPSPNSRDFKMRPQPDRFVGIAGEDENYDDEPVAEKENGNASSITAAGNALDAISFCVIDDALLISEDKEVLKFIISRIDGAALQSLADSESYKKTMAAVGPIHDIDFYVNIEAIVKNIRSQDNSGQVAPQITAFGFDNVVSLGAAISVGRNIGSPVAVKGILRINGEKKGIMKIIEPQNLPLKPPKFVDASTVSLTVLNISIKNAYEELSKIMSTISPMLAAAINAPIVPADEKGQGAIELKKDILDYLGSVVTVSASIKKPFTAGQDPAKTITAIAVADRAALEKSLARLHGFLCQGKTQNKREMMGYTIYLLDGSLFPFMMGGGRQPLANTAENADRPQTAKMAFTVTDSHLILGTEENVAGAIRLLNNKEAASLENAQWFVLAKSTIPGSVGMAGLSDSRTYGEYIWWLFKENAKSKNISNAIDPMQMAVAGFEQFADFNLLPSFEKVKKYFGASTQYAISRPDGYFFEMRMLDTKTE